MSTQNPDWVGALKILASCLQSSQKSCTREELINLGRSKQNKVGKTTTQTPEQFTNGFNTALNKLQALDWVEETGDNRFRPTPRLTTWVQNNSLKSLNQSAIDRLVTAHKLDQAKHKTQTGKGTPAHKPVPVNIPWAKEPQQPAKNSPSPSPQPNKASEQTIICQLPQATEAQPSTVQGIQQTLLDRLHEATITQLETFLDEITPEKFEILCGDLLEKLGYGRAKVTGGSNDGGIDGIVSSDPFNIRAVAYQAKHYRADRQITQVQIQQFIGAVETYPQQRFEAAFFITTSSFHQGAIETAQRAPFPVRLIDRHMLIKLMFTYKLALTPHTLTVLALDENYLK